MISHLMMLEPVPCGLRRMCLVPGMHIWMVCCHNMTEIEGPEGCGICIQGPHGPPLSYSYPPLMMIRWL